VEYATIPREEFFNSKGYCIGGQNYSLYDIEHGILRANRPKPLSQKFQFASDDNRLVNSVDALDPRIHFVLLLGYSDRPVEPSNLESVLYDSAKEYISTTTSINAENRKIMLSVLFETYAGDFGSWQDIINFITNNRFLSLSMLEEIDQIKTAPSYHGTDPNSRVYRSEIIQDTPDLLKQ